MMTTAAEWLTLPAPRHGPAGRTSPPPVRRGLPWTVVEAWTHHWRPRWVMNGDLMNDDDDDDEGQVFDAVLQCLCRLTATNVF